MCPLISDVTTSPFESNVTLTFSMISTKISSRVVALDPLTTLFWRQLPLDTLFTPLATDAAFIRLIAAFVGKLTFIPKLFFSIVSTF